MMQIILSRMVDQTNNNPQITESHNYVVLFSGNNGEQASSVAIISASVTGGVVAITFLAIVIIVVAVLSCKGKKEATIKEADHVYEVPVTVGTKDVNADYSMVSSVAYGVSAFKRSQEILMTDNGAYSGRDENDENYYYT